MNAKDAIRSTMDLSLTVLNSYVSDLSDADLLRRPAPGCNHLAWQLGHLISSEAGLLNAVCPGLLKTSASAGIPGYVDSYLYAEQVIPRRRAITIEETASTAVFLLSPRSSGLNAQGIVVDAGMAINYFDSRLVRRPAGG